MISSYKPKKNCQNGHRPWPKGGCSKCMASNVVVKEQPYRHCDGFSIVDGRMEKFIQQWQKNPEKQRACVFFGRYIDEPTETGNIGAVRAEVFTAYYPPQIMKPDGVELLLF